MNKEETIDKIRQLHGQANKGFKMFLGSAREAGELLRGLKETIKNETWVAFCARSFTDIGIGRLQVYMRVARNWEKVNQASSINEALELLRQDPARRYPARRFGYNAIYRLFRASIKDWDKEERETLLRQPHLLQDSLMVLRQRIHRQGLKSAA